MFDMFIKQLLLFFLLFCIVLFSLRVIYGLLVFLFRKDTTAMYVSSFSKHIRLMESQLKITHGKRLVDLGCGDGTAMRFFTRVFGLQCDGYEFQWFPYRYGKLCNSLLGYPQIHLYHQNFFQADLKRYDYIYTYLLPQQMAEIEPRIFKHMSIHTIIISNSFQFAHHTPYEVIKDTHGKPSIFLYKKT